MAAFSGEILELNAFFLECTISIYHLHQTNLTSLPKCISAVILLLYRDGSYA